MVIGKYGMNFRADSKTAPDSQHQLAQILQMKNGNPRLLFDLFLINNIVGQ